MTKDYKTLTKDISEYAGLLKQAAPDAMNGFYAMSKGATADGALDKKTKVARFNPKKLNDILDGISDIAKDDFKYLKKYPILRLGRYLKKYMDIEFVFQVKWNRISKNYVYKSYRLESCFQEYKDQYPEIGSNAWIRSKFDDHDTKRALHIIYTLTKMRQPYITKTVDEEDRDAEAATEQETHYKITGEQAAATFSNKREKKQYYEETVFTSLILSDFSKYMADHNYGTTGTVSREQRARLVINALGEAITYLQRYFSGAVADAMPQAPSSVQALLSAATNISVAMHESSLDPAFKDCMKKSTHQDLPNFICEFFYIMPQAQK